MNIRSSLKELFDKASSFFKPGYVITVQVRDVDKTILSKVIDILKNNGFIFVTENSHPVRKGYLLSSYLKSFSSERNHCIYLTCHYPKNEYPEKRLEEIGLIIENDVRGRESAIKFRMDELGDLLLNELSKYAGKERTFVTRHTTGPRSG